MLSISLCDRNSLEEFVEGFERLGVPAAVGIVRKFMEARSHEELMRVCDGAGLYLYESEVSQTGTGAWIIGREPLTPRQRRKTEKSRLSSP